MRELRQIIFTDDEVVAGLSRWKRRRAEALPAGTLKTFNIAQVEPMIVALEIAGDTGETHTFRFYETEIAAALIAFLIERKVPLPIESEKSLTQVKGAVALMITKGFRTTAAQRSKAVAEEPSA